MFYLGPFVSAEEVGSLLVQAGMFDAAIKLATKLSLPLVPILEALASRYLHMCVHMLLHMYACVCLSRMVSEFTPCNFLVSVHFRCVQFSTVACG